MSDPPALEPGYFLDSLRTADPEVHEALAGELERQQDGIELIASENLVSQASLEALGSIIVNKTVEGRPGGRYYGGAEFADRIETLAIERAKALFGCGFANVQPIPAARPTRRSSSRCSSRATRCSAWHWMPAAI